MLGLKTRILRNRNRFFIICFFEKVKIKACKIKIGGKEFEDIWQISVADNGIGIPNDKKEKVFDLFEKHSWNV